MDPTPNLSARMQDKLAQGLQKLRETSPEDPKGLGAALVHLHGAMEDFVRLELAQKAPHLRAAAEDPQTSWNDLLEHGRTYMGFTENDCTILTEAEAQREAHRRGRNFTYTYTDLVNYAQFAQKWVRWSSVSAQSVQSSQSAQSGQGQANSAANRPAYPQEPHRPWDDRDYLRNLKRPWYRSTLVLFILFFVFPPLWALLIITDRARQPGWLRGLAALELVIVVFLCIFLLSPVRSIRSTAFQNVWNMINGITSPTPVILSVPTMPSLDMTPPSFDPDALGGSAVCSIVWVEGSSDALAGMNRAMVWTQVVAAKVEGSGLTSTQFYELVVEHNPQLAADGYEFKAGQTYSLPQCEGG